LRLLAITAWVARRELPDGADLRTCSDFGNGYDLGRIGRPPVPDERFDGLVVDPHVVEGLAGDQSHTGRKFDRHEFNRMRGCDKWRHHWLRRRSFVKGHME